MDLGEIAAAAGIDAGKLLDIAEPYMGGNVFEMTRSKEFLVLMRNAGFDGIYVEEDGVPTSCAIGSPEQVKLTNNKNPSQNPDIRYSMEETPEQENDRRTAVDTDQAEAYDGDRMTAAQGGSYNGPGAQRNDGDSLSAQVRRPETVDTGIRGRGIQTNGRIQEEQGQRAGVPRWARGHLIDGTDRQGGFDDGQDEYDAKGVPGEDVWRGIEGTDSGRTGEGRTMAGTGRTEDGRSQGPAAWAREHLIDNPSRAAGIAAENAARYGANVFVVEDAAIKAKNQKAWALTSDRSVYISNSIPAELANVVGFHEAVHAAKQQEFGKYLDFLNRTNDFVEFGTARSCFQPRLLVVRSKEPGILIVNSFFHVGGLIIHEHIEAVLSAVDDLTDEKHIRVRGFLCLQIGPVFRLGVHGGLFFAFSAPRQSEHQDQYPEQRRAFLSHW